MLGEENRLGRFLPGGRPEDIAGEYQNSAFLGESPLQKVSEFNSDQIACHPVGRLGDWTAETATDRSYSPHTPRESRGI